jgi:hypothetical protein
MILPSSNVYSADSAAERIIDLPEITPMQLERLSRLSDQELPVAISRSGQDIPGSQRSMMRGNIAEYGEGGKHILGQLHLTE